MSGHNKWSSIKHKKGAMDAKRGKIFTKIIKDITIAVRDGGVDIANNSSLRLAFQNAKGANMPKETIDRAIKKGSVGDGENLVEMTFEGHGPMGISIFVEATTDNNNRTVSNVRSIFSKHGGELGKNGELSYLFERKGVFTIETDKLAGRDLEEFEMELIDGGLEEMESEEDLVVIYVSFDNFGLMQKLLEEMNIEAQSAELQRIPNATTSLSVTDSQKVLRLIEKMEEDDDVSVVYHNLEMTDELEAALNN